MSVNAKDITAVENLNAKFAAALNDGAMSLISDLATPNAFVLPPAQNVMKGARVLDAWRGLAMRYENVKFLTTDIEAVGPDALIEIGTFSARPKQADEPRVFFKYQFVWQRIGESWKLASMVWNRPGAARGQGRPGAGAAQASQEM